MKIIAMIPARYSASRFPGKLDARPWREKCHSQNL